MLRVGTSAFNLPESVVRNFLRRALVSKITFVAHSVRDLRNVRKAKGIWGFKASAPRTHAYTVLT